MANELYGEHACWCCGKAAPVKRTSGSKLRASCDWCGLVHYAEPGTAHYRKLERDTTPIAQEPPATAPAAAAEPAPAKPKAKAGGFNPMNPGG